MNTNRVNTVHVESDTQERTHKRMVQASKKFTDRRLNWWWAEVKLIHWGKCWGWLYQGIRIDAWEDDQKQDGKTRANKAWNVLDWEQAMRGRHGVGRSSVIPVTKYAGDPTWWEKKKKNNVNTHSCYTKLYSTDMTTSEHPVIQLWSPYWWQICENSVMEHENVVRTPRDHNIMIHKHVQHVQYNLWTPSHGACTAMKFETTNH